MVRSWTSVWDVIRSTPGASSRHLGGRTRRDENGTSVGDGQTKFNQGRKASVKRLPTPPSRAGRDASSGKKPRLWRPLFSLLQMGSSSSRTTPLKCIFSKMLGQVWSPEFKKTCLIFCDTEWPRNPLEHEERSSVEGSQLLLFYN